MLASAAVGSQLWQHSELRRARNNKRLRSSRNRAATNEKIRRDHRHRAKARRADPGYSDLDQCRRSGADTEQGASQLVDYAGLRARLPGRQTQDLPVVRRSLCAESRRSDLAQRSEFTSTTRRSDRARHRQSVAGLHARPLALRYRATGGPSRAAGHTLRSKLDRRPSEICDRAAELDRIRCAARRRDLRDRAWRRSRLGRQSHGQRPDHQGSAGGQRQLFAPRHAWLHRQYPDGARTM